MRNEFPKLFTSMDTLLSFITGIPHGLLYRNDSNNKTLDMLQKDTSNNTIAQYLNLK